MEKLRCLQEAYDLAPTNIYAIYELALRYTQTSDYGEALPLWEAFLGKHPALSGRPSVDMLDQVYGHLVVGAEQVARAKLDAAAGRSGV